MWDGVRVLNTLITDTHWLGAPRRLGVYSLPCPACHTHRQRGSGGERASCMSSCLPSCHLLASLHHCLSRHPSPCHSCPQWQPPSSSPPFPAWHSCHPSLLCTVATVGRGVDITEGLFPPRCPACCNGAFCACCGTG